MKIIRRKYPPPGVETLFPIPGKFISIYPNPFQQQFSCEFELFLGGNVEVSIVASSGQQILAHNFGRKNAGNYRETLSLPSGQNGILLLVLKLDGAVVDTEKILCN